MLKISFLEKPEKLVEIALKRASKRAIGTRDRGRKSEKTAVCFSNYLMERLEKAVTAMPSEARLGAFNYELLLTMEPERNIQKMRSHLATAKKLLAKRKRAALRGIRKHPDGRHFSELLGRSNSILRSLDETFKRFNALQKKLKELPSIDRNAKTLILAGYPNSGKTTVLKRLTGSSPKIAAYAFTTKKLNLGSFEWKFMRIQVVDTPGLLDRKVEKRNEIEKRALLALSHLADLVGFIVDCSEQAASLQKQLSLFKNIRKEFAGIPTIVLLNKVDVATEGQKDAARELFSEWETVEFYEEKSGKIRELVGKSLY